MSAAPAGFELSERTGPFVDLVGPLYTRTIEGVVTLRLCAADKHLNARDRVHGAVMAALLDLAMGRNITSATGRAVVTASLTSSFLSAAKLGDWLEASAAVTRAGRSLAFAGGAVTVEGRPAATGVGTFAFVEATR